jgi:glycerophosphoryl diester phosphodiesterase
MKIGTALLLLLVCLNTVTAQKNIITQGHRGCRGLMPENTIAAMKKAIDLGVQVLELDVVISKDKQVVVSHDTYMAAEISLKPSGDMIAAAEEKNLLLYNMTYAEIKKYDVGSKHNTKFPQQQNFPAYKPLLSELIDSADLYAKLQGKPLPSYNIEIKSQPEKDDIEHPKTAEFVELVMNVLKDRNIIDRMNIQSFDVRPLQLIHQKDPAIKLAFLTANAKSITDNLTVLGFAPAFYSPYYKTVTGDGVKICHDKSIKIIPWTVNTKEEINALINLGADGIITDYPDLF